jgi:hypothetical protein
MENIENLKAFCEGYLMAYMRYVDMDTSDVDDWITWGGYDIKLCGAEHADVGDKDFQVCAYPENSTRRTSTTDRDPDPIHKFTI